AAGLGVGAAVGSAVGVVKGAAKDVDGAGTLVDVSGLEAVPASVHSVASRSRATLRASARTFRNRSPMMSCSSLIPSPSYGWPIPQWLAWVQSPHLASKMKRFHLVSGGCGPG